MSDSVVLFVGQAQRPELAEVVARLQVSTSVMVARDVPAALAIMVEYPAVYRLMLAPSYRDEFPHHQLQHLVRQQPLAAIVMLVGPWIEGETRSGKSWAGARRVYMHQVIPWGDGVRRDLLATSAPYGGWQPATLGVDELWPSTSWDAWSTLAGTVIVCGELLESRLGLKDLCRAVGLTTIGHPPHQLVECSNADAVIYDAVADRRCWGQQISQLVQWYRPRACVVLINFPRPDESRWLRQAGASAVLGKPFYWQDLLACLTPAMAAPRRTSARLLG
jgi:hypothetical protein